MTCLTRARAWSLTLALCWALPTHAQGGAPAPVYNCETDADCVGCESCDGNVCTSRSATCVCDDECEQRGLGVCEPMRADQPLCGGQCSSGLAASGVFPGCGLGPDELVHEPWTLSIAPTTDVLLAKVEGHEGIPAVVPPAPRPRGVGGSQGGPPAGRASLVLALSALLLAALAGRPRRRWLAVPVTALSLAAGCGLIDSDQEEESEPPDDPRAALVPDELTEAEGVSVDCADYELFGPVLHVKDGATSTAQLAAVGETWLVSASDSAEASNLQLVAPGVAPKGRVMKLSGAARFSIVDTPGGLVVRGSVGDSYSVEGHRHALGRLSSDLMEVSEAHLLRGPSVTYTSGLLTADDSRIELYQEEQRTLVGVRYTELSASGIERQQLLVLDALQQPGVRSAGAQVPLDGRLHWIFSDDTKLSSFELDPVTLEAGAVQSLGELPDAWWYTVGPDVGGVVPVHFPALDQNYLFDLSAGLAGEPVLVDLDWSGRINGMVRVGERLVVHGDTSEVGEPSKTVVRVYDAASYEEIWRGEVYLPGIQPDEYTMLRGAVAAGGELAVLFGVWGGSAGSQSYVARLGCL